MATQVSNSLTDTLVAYDAGIKQKIYSPVSLTTYAVWYLYTFSLYLRRLPP